MFELVNKARKNRGGFSLVELIVVVLIIAIIAVALAPQVMKYVGQARTGTDANNAANIKAAVQTNIADFQAAGAEISAIQGKYELKSPTTIRKETSNGSSSAAAFATSLSAVLTDVPATHDSTKAGWLAEIGSNGGVTVTTASVTVSQEG